MMRALMWALAFALVVVYAAVGWLDRQAEGDAAFPDGVSFRQIRELDRHKNN